jgi:hypothetical protein
MVLAPSAQATIWKCQVEGKPVFSDKPCVGQGDQLDVSSGYSSGFSASREDMLRDQVRRRHAERSIDPSRARAAGNIEPHGSHQARAVRPSHCPSRREMANLRTSFSSTQLKPEQLLSAELEAAERCHRGIGAYTASDWSELRDIRTDVGSLDAGARRRGAAREAAVYRLVDPQLAQEFAERVRVQELRQRCLQRGSKVDTPTFNQGPSGCLASEGP